MAVALDAIRAVHNAVRQDMAAAPGRLVQKERIRRRNQDHFTGL